MKRAAATVCACSLAALAQTAAAGAAPITLLSPNVAAQAPPPLAGGAQLSSEPGEVRIPGPLVNEEAVRVGLGPDGTPVSIVVRQRMRITGLGDFRFVVPAPASDVAALPGSQSVPGLRQSGIVWQGFSPGKRLLAALIRLDPRNAAGGLPLRVRVDRRNGVTSVRLENRTSKQFAITLGSASQPVLRTALARIREQLGRQFASGRPGPLTVIQIDGRPTKQEVVALDAPLHVTGTVSVAGARTAKVDTTLGGGDRPASRIVQVRGSGSVQISLTASFDRDLRRLLPTTAQLLGAGDPIRLLQTSLGRAAVAQQYQQYLASPKPNEASTSAYRFATTRIAKPAVVPVTVGGDNGLAAWALALIALGGLAALGGLTVLWAHL